MACSCKVACFHHLALASKGAGDASVALGQSRHGSRAHQGHAVTFGSADVRVLVACTAAEQSLALVQPTPPAAKRESVRCGEARGARGTVSSLPPGHSQGVEPPSRQAPAWKHSSDSPSRQVKQASLCHTLLSSLSALLLVVVAAILGDEHLLLRQALLQRNTGAP